jgi:hypothetical protein
MTKACHTNAIAEMTPETREAARVALPQATRVEHKP